MTSYRGTKQINHNSPPYFSESLRWPILLNSKARIIKLKAAWIIIENKTRTLIFEVLFKKILKLIEQY